MAEDNIARERMSRHLAKLQDQDYQRQIGKAIFGEGVVS